MPKRPSKLAGVAIARCWKPPAPRRFQRRGTLTVGQIQPFDADFLFSAQRFFIISDSRFLPAAVRPPRFLGAAAFATVGGLFEVGADFALRAAQRAFIAAASRLLPAGVIPPRRVGARALRSDRRAGPVKPVPSSRALMALPIRSCSLFSSATILSRSNLGLLFGSRPSLGI